MKWLDILASPKERYLFARERYKFKKKIALQEARDIT